MLYWKQVTMSGSVTAEPFDTVEYQARREGKDT